MKAAVIEHFGAPHEVIRCGDLPDPGAPANGHVVVRMLLAPINPADLLTIGGTYGRVIEFPFVPGTEGLGRVEAVGKGVAALKLGDLVVPMPRNTWQERLVARESLLIKVPEDGPLEQLAMLKVNPATAQGLLSNFASLKASDWVMQNVAHSGVGQYVIQIAARMGVNTVNVVRRAELADPLRAIGGTVVIVDDLSNPDRFANAVKTATGGANIRLGLDAVAGPATNAMAAALGDNAELVVYGTLSRTPCQIDGRLLFQHGRVLRGFWLTAWYQTTPLDQIRSLLARLAGEVAAGNLRSEIEAVYPLDRIADAVAHAGRGGRSGKILIALAPEMAR